MEGNHEKPTLGELNTISGGFTSGGTSAMGRKRYARSVMVLSTEEVCMTSLNFTEKDLKDVFPHDNDLVMISVVIRSRRIHMTVNNHSSYNVMLGRPTINKL